MAIFPPFFSDSLNTVSSEGNNQSRDTSRSKNQDKRTHVNQVYGPFGRWAADGPWWLQSFCNSPSKWLVRMKWFLHYWISGIKLVRNILSDVLKTIPYISSIRKWRVNGMVDLPWCWLEKLYPSWWWLT